MTTKEKEAYRQKVEAKMDRWRAEMDKLRADASEAKAKAKLDAISRLESLQLEASNRLAELKTAGEATWQATRKAVDRAVDEFESTYHRVVR